MSYKLSHLDDIHVTATADAPLSDANKLEGLKTCSFSRTNEHAELKHIGNSDGWSDFEALWSSMSGTLAGDVKVGSASQKVLVDALEGRTPFYLHLIDNAGAASGQRMGRRLYLTIESGEEPREAGSLVTFSFAVKVKGKPADILAS
jgi:hypothetical protein